MNYLHIHKECITDEIVKKYAMNIFYKRTTQDLIMQSRTTLARDLTHDLSVTRKEVKE